jgi:3,4-dihydroxy 2-butanone 4-phosphate synthase/GTP cyclohydrolase II
MTALGAASRRFADGGPVLVAPDDPAGTAFVAAPAEGITAAGLETLGALGGGRILLALDDAITRRLALPEVGPGSRPRAPLPFLVPIDAAQSPGRRWSVVDPALTMRVAAAADSGPDDLAVPGRVQPVGATRRRLLDDGGSVSAALALAHHAGRREAVALCAVADRRALPAHLPRAETAALRAHVQAELAVSARLPTTHGDFRVIAQSGHGGAQTLALVHGDPAARTCPIVATHAACLFGDTFGSLICDCRRSLDRSLAEIVTDGGGVVIYTRPASGPALVCGSGRRPDERVVAGLLRLIGIDSVRLTQASAAVRPALEGLGIAVRTA